MGLRMIEVHSERDVNDTHLQSNTRLWIVDALTKFSKGDFGDYNKLLIDLKCVSFEDPTSIIGLVIRLKALSQSVSFIKEPDHGALLTHIFRMSLWTCNHLVADVLVNLIVNLATANGALVSQCLDMLVRNFLPPSCGLPTFMDIYTASSLMRGFPMEKVRQQSIEHLAQKDDVLGRVHSAIHQIAELVPTTPLRLQPIVLQRMPHKIVDKEWSVLYLENMLRLESSAAGQLIGRRIILAIVDRLIEIDVEIRWEDILQAENSSKVFLLHMDLEEDHEELEENPGAPNLSGPGSEAKLQHGLVMKASDSKLHSLGEVADKMDLMMDLTLEHLQGCVSKGRAGQLYDTLMISFQNTILDTYKSKFTQFLIFYLCALAPFTCGTSFACFLCDIFSSKLRSQNMRMSAAAYLASYLARARYLPTSTVSSCLKRMVSWCIGYSPAQDDHKSSVNHPKTLVHGVFYSVCQAVMYVLCFRLRELVEDPEQKTALRSLKLQQLVEHRLNPLNVCLPSVVEEFLKQAKAMQLVNVNALEFCRAESDSCTFGGDNQLDMFFPFDPYLLKRSDRFIRPNFIYWSMVQLPEEKALNFDGGDYLEESEQHNLGWNSDSDCSVRIKTPKYVDTILARENGYGSDEMEEFWTENQRNTGPLENATALRSFASDDGDDNDVDAFRMSIDRMSITPPAPRTLLKMPARLPYNA
ncbi:hypothetical protein O6H91_13G000700 [Diphasiastrum complanatum]|uniref:Uncharacterized protein n=5 Tax=Diphasiastrum complanatum TaxID=34168 RepID=A0ACC2BRH8_DIPCM|nr:hypothetical protein O6H91_13G000700 [Diphasiastrum complanatum]KAJ7532366.1 hypothetical protein O6H91_13G000700 [Diphasiastrum complanatum]KAJ7532367.1 hypothetical protein O6H91_13G000700 [Diphasiastrum complanatum]KAJ7532368.1 hypothetical protein O6H91_13G000700 [Diphasiastrum complanatum]KAJ7532369.1 hypothetical protein O6H91_13G000700 [Diphasiastrum complanatum]